MLKAYGLPRALSSCVGLWVALLPTWPLVFQASQLQKDQVDCLSPKISAPEWNDIMPLHAKQEISVYPDTRK